MRKKSKKNIQVKPEKNSSPSRNNLLFIILLGCCGVLVAITSILSFAGVNPGNIDDAFITLVYSRHLADHGLFYWNFQDGNVDGFTSFLDMVIKAGLIKLTSMDPVELAWWMALLWHSAVGLSAFFLAISLNIGKPRWQAFILSFIGGLAIASSPGLAEGSSFLLETPLFVLSSMWVIVFLALKKTFTGRQSAIWTLLLVITSLIRPEGLIIVVCLSCFAVMEDWGNAYQKNKLRSFMALSGIMVVYLAWHFREFGSLAPNTYYAKASVSRLNEIKDGFQYLFSFFNEQWGAGIVQLAVIVLAPFLVFWKFWERSDKRGYFILSGSALLTLAIVVLSGGDCYPGKRFLALPIILMLVSLLYAGSRLTGRMKILPIGLLFFLATLQVIGIAKKLPEKIDSIQNTWPLTEKEFGFDSEVVSRISALIKDGDIAQSDFQRFKYFSDKTKVIDLHGLNDKLIAHIPMKGQVLWGKFSYKNAIKTNAPVWIYGAYLYSDIPMATIPIRKVLFDPEIYNRFIGFGGFASEEDAQAIEAAYLSASLPIGDKFFNFFIRRDWGARLASDRVFVNSINIKITKK